MSNVEIVKKHLSLLFDAIPKPEAIRRRFEEPPKSFDTSDAIERLLEGENPSTVFGLEVRPFLTQKDLGNVYTHRLYPWSAKDWRKKKVVNTLRSAASLSIQTELNEYEVQAPLPTPGINITKVWPSYFAKRSAEIIRLAHTLANDLQKPQSDTTLEKVLVLLSGYFKTSIDSARTQILTRMSEETDNTGITYGFLPGYFNLIYSIFERDKKIFEELSTRHLTLDLYKQLCLSSQGIILRGATTTLGEMSAYFSHIATYSQSGNDPFIMHRDSFELAKSVKRNARSPDYFVRLKPEINRNIKKTFQEQVSARKFRVMLTQCPAMARDRHTGESTSITDDEDSTPNLNLIQTILYKTVLG